MNTDFPRILSLLRKERGLTQKQVAADLGIAQALLSHYEKGKRECGLEFLVKAADYYNVSTDYLLGRSPVSNGGIITESDIPDGNSSGDSKSGDIMLALNKKLITNSIEVIFSILQKIKSSKLSKSVSSMLTLSVYKAFRITYNANRKNDDNLFGVSPTSALHLIDSAICLEVGAAADAANDADNAPSITTNSIEAEYDKQGTALLSLIKNAEKRLDRINTNRFRNHSVICDSNSLSCYNRQAVQKSPVGNARSYGQFQVLRSLKKSVSSFAHSSCKTLLLTIGRWLNG